MQIGIGISLTGGGQGARYSAEALSAFAAMSTQPSAPLKALYDACIVSLKNSGIWAKLDALYLMNVETAQAARVNIKNPGTYNLTATSSPTFTAKVGYAGDGAAAFLNTNFNPTTATSPNFVQDSGAVFVWGLKSGQDSSPIFGGAGAHNTYLFPRFTDDKIYARLNSASDVTVSVADGLGLVLSNRSGAGATQIYKAGASVATGTPASAAPTNLSFAILRNTLYYNGSAAMAGFGSSMSSQNSTDLYTALNTFKTGVDAL